MKLNAKRIDLSKALLRFSLVFVVASLTCNLGFGRQDNNQSVVLLKPKYFKIPSTIPDAAIDPVSGTLALAHGNKKGMALYPPDAFQAGGNSAPDAPLLENGVSQEEPVFGTFVQYVVKNDQSWLVFSSNSEPTGYWICNPTTLEPIDVVGFDKAKGQPIGVDGARDGRIWIHDGSRDVMTFLADSPQQVNKVRTQYVKTVATAKSSLLIGDGVNYKSVRGNDPDEIVGMSGKAGPKSWRILPDHHEKYTMFGYELRNLDGSKLLGEVWSEPRKFGHDDPILICCNRDFFELTIVSIPDCQILARVDLSAIKFAQMMNSGYSRDDIQLDEKNKRIFVIGEERLVVVDYSKVKIPNKLKPKRLAEGKELAGVSVIKLNPNGASSIVPQPDPSKVPVAALKSRNRDEIANDNADGGHPAPAENMDEEVAGTKQSTSIDQYKWPSFKISFSDNGLLDPQEDFKDRTKYRFGLDAYPEGCDADRHHFAAWFAKNVIAYDVESGKRIWSHRFDHQVLKVVVNPKHIFVDLVDKEAELIRTIAMVAETGDIVCQVEPLTRVWGGWNTSHWQHGSVGGHGVVLYRDGSIVKATVSDDTLEPVESLGDPGWEFGRLVDGGVEFVSLEKPALIFLAPDPFDCFVKPTNFLRRAFKGSDIWNLEANKHIPDDVLLRFGPPNHTFKSSNNVELIAYRGTQALKYFQVSPVPQTKDNISWIKWIDPFFLYCAEGHVYKLDRSKLLQEPLNIEPQFERQQSTIETTADGETKLVYRLRGGVPPLKVEGACWISGRTPDSIQAKSVTANHIEADLYEVGISFSAQEFDTIAMEFFKSSQVSEKLRGSFHLLMNEGKNHNKKDVFKYALKNYSEVHEKFYERATGQESAEIPIPMPIRLRVTDANGRKGYFAHYIFHQFTKRQATAGMKQSQFGQSDQ